MRVVRVGVVRGDCEGEGCEGGSCEWRVVRVRV